MRNKLDNVKSRKEEIEKLYEEILSKYENSKEKIKEKESITYCVQIKLITSIGLNHDINKETFNLTFI